MCYIKNMFMIALVVNKYSIMPYSLCWCCWLVVWGALALCLCQPLACTGLVMTGSANMSIYYTGNLTFILLDSQL